MFRTILFAAVLTAGAVLTSGTAAASGAACTKHDRLVKALERKYQEKRRGLGVAAKGTALMEFFVSQDGSWTVVMTMTSGLACIVAAGHTWEDVAQTAAVGPET